MSDALSLRYCVCDKSNVNLLLSWLSLQEIIWCISIKIKTVEGKSKMTQLGGGKHCQVVLLKKANLWGLALFREDMPFLFCLIVFGRWAADNSKDLLSWVSGWCVVAVLVAQNVNSEVKIWGLNWSVCVCVTSFQGTQWTPTTLPLQLMVTVFSAL